MSNRTALIVLFAVVLTCAGCVQPPERNAVALAVPVEVAAYSGASVKSGCITLYDEVYRQAPDSDHVVLEAEQYDDVFWQPAVRTTSVSEQWMFQVEAHGKNKSYADEAASGGAYLERVSAATYPFMVNRAGTYTVWMRLWRPGKQYWIFRYQIDGSEMVPVKLEADRFKTYYWQKVGTTALEPGSHLFAFKDLHNGKRIDKILMTLDEGFVPEGEGPPASPREPTEAGTVDFQPLRPAGVGAYMGLDVPTLEPGGSASAEVSFDGGTTWQPSGHPSLEGRPVTADDGVLVRLKLARADGKAPRVGIPHLRLLAPAAHYPAITNGTVRYTFDITRGCLAGIELLQPKHRVVMPRGVYREPFRVMYRKKTDAAPVAEWLEFDRFKMIDRSVSACRVRFTFRADDAPVEVTTDYRLNPAGYLDAKVTLANRGFEHDLQEVEFLRLGHLRIGEDSRDDTLIWPVGTGKLYPEPTTKARLTMNYPTAVVGYFDLFDDVAGLYVGTHDAGLISTVLLAEPDPSRTWMNVRVTKRDRVRPGQSKTFPLAVGVHAGKWYAGAHWYKAWYNSAFDKPAWPEWLAESDGWHFDNISFTRPPFRCLDERIFRKAMRLGFQHVQIWGTTTSGSCPMYYMPPMDLGGPEGFAAGNAWWKSRGGVVGYYMCPNYVNSFYFHDLSTHHFGTPWEDIPAWGRPPGKLEGTSWQWILENAHYDASLKPPVADVTRWQAGMARNEKAGKGMIPPRPQQRMSALAQPFLDWFKFWVVDKYVGEFGCRAMYLDTMHYGAEGPEFNPFMNMFGEGHGGKVRQQWCKDLRDKARRLDPMFLPVQEMQCDAYGMYVAYMIGASAIDSEMLRYTHPDHVAFEGQSGSGWGPRRFKRFNSMWLYGTRLDHREEEGWAVETIRMRRWMTRWINAARFLDDRGLTVSAPELKAKLHRVATDDGSRGFVVTFWNTARREANPGNATIADRQWPDYEVTVDLGVLAEVDDTGTTPKDWVPERAVLVDLNRKPKVIDFSVTTVDGRPQLSFKAPARQINGVLFVSRAEGPRAVLSRVDQVDYKQLDVTLMNVQNTAADVTVAVRPQAAHKFAITEKTVKAKPGELVTLSFPYADGTPPEVTELVLVDVTADGTTRTLRGAAYPFLDDASFERGRLGTYTDEMAADGRRSRLLRQGERIHMVMEGSKKYRLGFKLRSPDVDRRVQLVYDQAIPRNRIDGMTLTFTKTIDVKADAWTDVTMTFETPEMYYDSQFYLRGLKGRVAIDEVTLEVLPDDAKVDHVPVMVGAKKK